MNLTFSKQKGNPGIGEDLDLTGKSTADVINPTQLLRHYKT